MVVIFDIDGTLTRSCDLDARVYADAFARTFGVALSSTDWSDYAHVTDQGIAEEAVDRLGLSREGIPAFKARFVEALGARLEEVPLEPIPGARTVVSDLIRAGHQAAFATGCWEDSVRLKLRSAGIDTGECVLVGCEEHLDRRDVLRAAIERMCIHDRTVYVGDGSWDVETTRALSMPFVGVDPVGSGRLGLLGVEQVVVGYEDLPAFLRALERAGVPGIRS